MILLCPISKNTHVCYQENYSAQDNFIICSKAAEQGDALAQFSLGVYILYKTLNDSALLGFTNKESCDLNNADEFL